MNQKDRPPWGDGFKPDVPPQYDDTADFSKSLYNKAHAPVSHNKNDHRHLDLEHHGLTYWEQRIAALGRLLVEKGIITLDEMRRCGEELLAQNITVGARVIARAWVDPDFKQRLLEDGTKACSEFGIHMEDRQPCELVAYEQTDDVHWVVVCTLCSCYPRAVLGQPPHWYKSTAYRNRVVVDPRGVLKDEFGTVIPDDVEIRVIDSTADTRFLIIPKRPEGTEGMSEEELADLVTCESVVGVAPAKSPGQARESSHP